LATAESINHWTDPALYIAALALFISAAQAIRSIIVEKHNRRVVQFIEVISSEFAKSEAALDLLEAKLRKALSNCGVTSEDVLEVALPAGRIANRAMTSVSNMPDVVVDLVTATKVDELDDIWNMAANGTFESASRTLHIQTALNIVTRVTDSMASAKKVLIHTHL